jgi:hypothetical protein
VGDQDFDLLQGEEDLTKLQHITQRTVERLDMAFLLSDRKWDENENPNEEIFLMGPAGVGYHPRKGTCDQAINNRLRSSHCSIPLPE